MAILVDSQTRLVVQGLTGREGRFHALRNREYGTNVVAGVTPGKAGQDVEGIPVFNTVASAVAETGANTSLIFVPARFAVDALYEAADAGIGVVVLITENIPVLDMTRAYNYIKAKGVALVGPNRPGVISPGRANVGIIPGEITHAGPVGLVSRSGTLTYQVMYEMAAAGGGQTTCVGIGGDPVVGSSFIDVLGRFQDDPETEAVVMIGEIGGDEEERAARFISERMDKPVGPSIAGSEAPRGKRMGHAGAIISGSSGTAQAKAEALEAAGVRVGRNPTEAAELAVAAVQDRETPRGPPPPPRTDNGSASAFGRRFIDSDRPVRAGRSGLGQHHRVHDLVREQALAPGVPDRPQEADVAEQGVQDVEQVADEGHAPAHGLAVGHPHQAQVQHLLAPALAGPAGQDRAGVDHDAERDQIEQERHQAGPGARGLARVGPAEQDDGQERRDGGDQVVDQVGADPLGPVGQLAAHVVAGRVADVAAGGRGRLVAGLGG